jgi:hypothetical protein
MHFMNPWDWFDPYEDHPDPQRRQLVDLTFEGWRYDGDFPDTALMIFQQGLQLAQQLHEPMWELFFDYLCAQVLVYDKSDMKVALDYVMRAATRVFQPRYLQCDPLRAKMLFVVCDTYFEIDPISYAPQIRALLQTIEQEFQMDLDTYLRMLTLRADLHFVFDEYAESLSLIEQMIALADDNEFRLFSGFSDLAELAYVRGDVTMALRYLHVAEHYAQEKENMADVAIMRLWQAVCCQRLGDQKKAVKLYQQGQRLYVQHQLLRHGDYYDATCEYLELIGEAGQALALRAEQMETVQASNSIHHISYAHLQTCRLRGRMGLPLQEALAAAHAVIEQVGDKSVFLKRLARVEADDFVQYPWQAQHPAGIG